MTFPFVSECYILSSTTPAKKIQLIVSTIFWFLFYPFMFWLQLISSSTFYRFILYSFLNFFRRKIYTLILILYYLTIYSRLWIFLLLWRLGSGYSVFSLTFSPSVNLNFEFILKFRTCVFICVDWHIWFLDIKFLNFQVYFFLD